jgi:hypothetical protein
MIKSNIIDTVKKITIDHFGITLEELESKTRTRERTIPRNIAIYILSEKFGFKPAELHTHFKKDRSTIYHAVEVMQQDLLTVRHIRVDFEAIYKIVAEKLVVKKINIIQDQMKENKRLKESEPDPEKTFSQELNIECGLMLAKV